LLLSFFPPDNDLFLSQQVKYLWLFKAFYWKTYCSLEYNRHWDEEDGIRGEGVSRRR
jgi:hypothetical protein